MLLIDGEEYFPALLHEISMAKKSIYLEAYIFEHEKIGKELEILQKLLKIGQSGKDSFNI